MPEIKLNMKKQDYFFIAFVLCLFLPFILFKPLTELFFSLTAQHGMWMSFFKFGILATMGEMIGLRIAKGCYNAPDFGLIPRAFVWGVLGVCINAAMIIFSKGTPYLMEYCGMQDAVAMFNAPQFTLTKLFVAFCISVAMNSIFAPIFMTFHKVTDTHIIQYKGHLAALYTPIPVGAILTNLNWNVQWNFVFKRTIPLFWYPAHTITFILPPSYRVLFAALLGVALGLILAIAARKK